MSIQGALAAAAAAFAALYFLRGLARELLAGSSRRGGACHDCGSGGCPARRLEKAGRPSGA